MIAAHSEWRLLTRPFLEREPGEPLERLAEFDMMRMFYVALSRAKNLLVIAHYRGRGQRINAPFKALLDAGFPRIPTFNLNALPAAQKRTRRCPRSTLSPRTI